MTAACVVLPNGASQLGGPSIGPKATAAQPTAVASIAIQQPEITAALVEVQEISERVTVKINEAVAKYGSLDALIKSAPEAYNLSRSVLKLFLQRPEELEAKMATLQQQLATLMDV